MLCCYVNVCCNVILGVRLLCVMLLHSDFSLGLFAHGFWERPVENSLAICVLSPVIYRILPIDRPIFADFVPWKKVSPSIKCCGIVWFAAAKAEDKKR